MHTSFRTLALLSWIIISITSCSKSHVNNVVEKDQIDNGTTFRSFGCASTNGYPFIRSAGPGSELEMNDMNQRQLRNQPIPEVLPADQDPAGCWGTPTNNLQLSVRFHKQHYAIGEQITAVVILRNLGTNHCCWWRNAMPDHGYRVTIWHGVKKSEWMRRQQTPDLTPHDIGPIIYPRDPYPCCLAPKTQDLTILELYRWFNLKTPGRYVVEIRTVITSRADKTVTEIISGKASFDVKSMESGPANGQ